MPYPAMLHGYKIGRGGHASFAFSISHYEDDDETVSPAPAPEDDLLRTTRWPRRDGAVRPDARRRRSARALGRGAVPRSAGARRAHPRSTRPALDDAHRRIRGQRGA